MRGGFHWSRGMYFRRLPDGGVEVTQTKEGGGKNDVVWQRVIPAAEWASIVTAVSKSGETCDGYRAALDFHGHD